MTARDVFGIVGTTQAGNFHVERVVAEGGFGVVYRAQHGAFRAPVALKCLKIPEEMTKQARSIFLEKFREEAELMFRLSAAIAEVVRPLHVDVLHLSDGRFVPFLALEWLEGESLDGIITRRRAGGQAPFGLHKVVKMLRPIAGALSRAHHFPAPQGAVSIIHRDLKPENIFVASIGGSESLKILDFGIAKAKRAASQAVGRVTGQRIAEDEMASFTPAYGAPEQWTPKTYGETGPWTDVWGLALCMVEALAGTPPIDGDTYVMRRVCLDEKRRPTPRAAGADVPIEVDRVFEKALSVDPRKRFKEIDAFWSELEAAMGLPQSFGRRDERREPGEPSKEGAADGPKSFHGSGPVPTPRAAVEPQRGPATSPSSARLARIELTKVPAGQLPALLRPDKPGPPDAAEASQIRRQAEAPEPVSAPVPSSQSRRKRQPSQEDWASLGLGDDAPASSRRRGSSDDLEMELSPPPSSNAGRAPASAPAARPPSARKLSAGFEFDLPTIGTGEAPPPPVVAAAVQSQPRPGPVIRYPSSADLEMSLPIHDGAEGPPPAGADYGPAAPAQAPPPQPYAPPARPQPQPPRVLPTPQDTGPRSRPSGEIELLLPAFAQGSAPEAPTNVGRMTGEPTAAVRAPSTAPPPGGALDFELGIPALKAPPAGFTPIGTAGLPPPAGLQPLAAAPRHELDAPEPEPPPGEMSAGQRLKAPLGILLASLLVAFLDIGYLKATGEHLMLGPVRPFWIAAPLALFGVGFTLWRLVGVQRDDES
jgi:eukaryotic-like serine/threonine-protein kinase